MTKDRSGMLGLTVVAAAVAMTHPGLAVGETLPEGFPQRRGVLVFVPTSALLAPEPHRLEWLSRFDLILTNGYDIAPERIRVLLQSAGSHLFLYVWSNGFTTQEARAGLPQSPWWRELLERHPQWLLNREPLPGPPGTPPSYYFDLSASELRQWLAAQLAHWRGETGYSGFFLDMAGSTALPERVLALWQATRPGLSYDQAFVELLRAVRDADPQAIIMTNQAFRTLPAALALVDYDLTESYGTSYDWGPRATVGDLTLAETFYRGWQGPAGLKALYAQVEKALAHAQPRRGFIYLDYMRPRYRPPAAEGQPWQPEVDAEAVYYSYVAARLWGQESFCSGWFAGMEYEGPLYFADLGRPLGDGPQEVGAAVMREYERGLVALLSGPIAAEVEVPLMAASAELYDIFSDQVIPLREGRAMIRMEPARSQLTGAVTPVGRVFLKTDAQR